MLSVRFIPAARHEFDDARKWYEQQRSGLGERFELSIHTKRLSIRERPDFFSLAHIGLREATVPRFPHTNDFRFEADEIIVASVFHQSRDPDVRQSRWEE